MNTATFEIHADLKTQLDLLAEQSYRSESDLANQAVALYLAQQRRINARIQEGWRKRSAASLFRMMKWSCSLHATTSRMHDAALHAARPF